MRILLTAFSSLLFLISYGQPVLVQSTCDTSSFSRFREVAIDLSWNRLVQIGHPFKDSLLIPDSLYMPFVKELSGIYHTKGTIPDTDTIFDILSRSNMGRSAIVPPYVYRLHDQSMRIDTNAAWAGRLVRGIIPTGNDTIDHILLDYHIAIDSKWQYSATVFDVYLTSSVPINPYALSRSISSMSGVIYNAIYRGVEESSSVSRVDSGWYRFYTFTYAYGDCIPYCIDHHYWIFKVYPDNCLIEFDSSYGGTLYIWTNLRPDINNTLTISPNPAINKLYISIPLQNIVPTVSDLTGHTYTVPYSGREMDISSLAAGIYYLRLQSSEGTIVRRFVKE